MDLNQAPVGLLLPLGSFLFSTCLCFAKVSPEFARPSLWRDLYIGNGVGNSGYVHTVTFSHRFLLFGSKLEFPWDCGTIQSHAKTLPCARSLSGKISIFDRMCPGVCPHFRGTITIKAEISKMRGVDEKLCYAYA